MKIICPNFEQRLIINSIRNCDCRYKMNNGRDPIDVFVSWKALLCLDPDVQWLSSGDLVSPDFQTGIEINGLEVKLDRELEGIVCYCR